ncbi:MAG: glycerophosphodiester phosphodiesterase [Bacillota bacterium]
MKKPLITAHTGCLNTPPNSIQSVLEGLKSGADIIEVDVRSTKDGVVVLLHDENVRTPDGMSRVQDMSFEELYFLTQYNNEIVRLDEVLPLIKDNHRVINLDVKEDSAIDPMIRTVEKYNMRDYSIISGCEKERAFYLKNHYRPYQVLLNTGLKSLETCKEDYDSFIKETCNDAIAASCCGININYHLCREELIDYAMLRCLPVLVWTIDSSDAMEKFLRTGVHSITSNEVRILMDLRDQI